MADKIWASSSSNDWATAGNWAPSGVPANGDDVYIDGSASNVDIADGLNQSAVTLASLRVSATYTGRIGTASAYLQVGATALDIGTPAQGGTTPSGSTRIKINLGSVQSAVTIHSTSTSSADTGLDPVRIIGTHASNTLTVLSGRVGVATTNPSESSTIATLNVVGQSSFATTGAGVTLGTVSNNGGNVVANSAITTLNAIAGTTFARGDGAITTVNADGGECFLWNRSGSTDIGTLNWNGAMLNFRGEPTSLTIGATNIKRGGTCQVFSSSQVDWGTVTFDATNQTSISMSVTD